MAEKKSVKITQISKDFNVKTKEILDIFKDAGIEKKSGAAVESEEYELFLHIATSTHQIKNIDDYLDGKTKITVIKEKDAEKEEDGNFALGGEKALAKDLKTNNSKEAKGE